MNKVVFITYKDNPALSDSDILLVEPMAKYDYEVIAAAWDNETIDWTKFHSLVFRSCWNYHYNTDKFINWLNKLEKLNIKTWNPLKIVKWNLNKFYLQDLNKNSGIVTIPTVYIKQGSQSYLKMIMEKSGWNEVVIKPAVGASGYKIFKSTITEAEQNQKNFTSLINSVDVMVQPLIPELVKNGETSMIFIDKKFSHAVNRSPKPGDYRSNYEFGGKEHRINNLSQNIIQTGQKIVEKIDSPLLYARVDGVEKNGQFLLMELELIEPYLFLDIAKETLDNFAEEFSKLDNL
jgi:glutathione synthase/RimK-type ligase-like ATP-grasp enzyme